MNLCGPGCIADALHIVGPRGGVELDGGVHDGVDVLRRMGSVDDKPDSSDNMQRRVRVEYVLADTACDIQRSSECDDTTCHERNALDVRARVAAEHPRESGCAVGFEEKL